MASSFVAYPLDTLHVSVFLVTPSHGLTNSVSFLNLCLLLFLVIRLPTHSKLWVQGPKFDPSLVDHIFSKFTNIHATKGIRPPTQARP